MATAPSIMVLKPWSEFTLKKRFENKTWS